MPSDWLPTVLHFRIDENTFAQIERESTAVALDVGQQFVAVILHLLRYETGRRGVSTMGPRQTSSAPVVPNFIGGRWVAPAAGETFEVPPAFVGAFAGVLTPRLG